MFLSGGHGPRNEAMNSCYTFKLSTNTLLFKENMNKPRYDHGLQKIAQKIFVFGGVAGGRIIKSSEVYDVVQNSWKNLPDMLEASADITCVIVKNKILISSENSRLMSYDIENEAYS